jgi:hypothetical protein
MSSRIEHDIDLADLDIDLAADLEGMQCQD